MTPKLASLFDGSGGFPLAGSLCGIEPIWASEIEPYPISVTRSRFPNMKHLGSVTEINGAEVEPVDVITFGSPCQDLSVAGKRAGLKHEGNGDEETTRSGLFMEAVRIIKEMREATNGVYPRIALWENVPGAFSSNKGEDFKTVLEEFIKIVEPEAPVLPTPDKSKWPNAGCIMGDGWSIAWRVLDAQYHGVPQRRRRIFLVADFRGERAAEILFKREGLRGYFAEGRAPWQTASADAERSVGADDREGNCLTPWDVQSKQIYTADGVAPPLYAGECRWGGGECYVAVPNEAVCYGISSYDSNAMKSSNPHSGIYEAETARTLDLNGGNPACNQGGIAVVQGVDVYNQALTGDKSKTLNSAATDSNHIPCVAYTMKVRSGCAVDSNGRAAGKGALIQTEQAGTLSTVQDQYLFQPMVYDARGNGDGEVVPTMTGDHERRVTDYTAVACIGNGQTDQTRLSEKVGALNCMHDQQAVLLDRAFYNQYIVRRLTPTECARLQGFPDKWGHPDSKTEFTDEETAFWQEVRDTYAEANGKPKKQYTAEQLLKWYNKLHTDSAEYKMWGNGVALPCVLYIMVGIAEVLNER